MMADAGELQHRRSRKPAALAFVVFFCLSAGLAVLFSASASLCLGKSWPYCLWLTIPLSTVLSALVSVTVYRLAHCSSPDKVYQTVIDGVTAFGVLAVLLTGLAVGLYLTHKLLSTNQSSQPAGNPTSQPGAGEGTLVSDLLTYTGILLAVLTIAGAALGWWLNYTVDKYIAKVDAAVEDFGKAERKLQEDFKARTDEIAGASRAAVGAVINTAHLSLSNLPPLGFTQQIPLAVLRSLRIVHHTIHQVPGCLEQLQDASNGALVLYGCGLYGLMTTADYGIPSTVPLAQADGRPLPLLFRASQRAAEQGDRSLRDQIDIRIAFALRAAGLYDRCRQFCALLERRSMEEGTEDTEGFYAVFARLLLEGAIYSQKCIELARTFSSASISNVWRYLEQCLNVVVLAEPESNLVDTTVALIDRAVPRDIVICDPREGMTEDSLGRLYERRHLRKFGEFDSSAWAMYYIAKYATELFLLLNTDPANRYPAKEGDFSEKYARLERAPTLCAWAGYLLDRKIQAGIADAAISAIYYACAHYIGCLQSIGEARLGQYRWRATGPAGATAATQNPDDYVRMARSLVQGIVREAFASMESGKIYLELQESFGTVSAFSEGLESVSEYREEQAQARRVSVGGPLTAVPLRRRIGMDIWRLEQT